ncbi:MAG: efflux RND transporter permease subunit [Paraburkholderia sp.]
MIQITAYDKVEDLDALWQRVRAKVTEASSGYPEGSIGPFVDDDFGRVAVASVAVTAPGFTMSEVREQLKSMREQLYALPGVERISLFGLQEDRVYVEFNRQRLAGLGIGPAAVMQQLRAQSIVMPGGLPSVSGLAFTVATTGEVRTLDDLRRFLIAVPKDGQSVEVALGEVAQIRAMPADPPETAAMYQGKPAAVLAVSMALGQNVEAFGAALRQRLDEIAKALPVGFSQHIVTFQADVVEREMGKMHHVMAETVVIVMAVVMLFLGWRTGLVVGAIVPLTILGSLIAMRVLNVELQTVSIAAIIIALGLLVDNGIVIAEDIERRLHAGEARRSACIEAGRTLAVPLLTSSLVIVLAFSPFFLGHTSTNEYLRSLPIVLAVTLLGSWALSLTVTPLLCLYFSTVPAHSDEEPAYDSKLYRGYRYVIQVLLRNKLAFIAIMLLLLTGAVGVLASLPYSFLPPSDRLQFQIPLTLQPGVESRETLKVVQDISQWLADSRQNPDVADSIGYVADGGPRIVLGLNPPLPASNVGYFTVSVHAGTDIDAAISRIRNHLLQYFPEVRAEPKRFSLGATESGKAVYRVIGPDETVLRAAAAHIEQALRNLPGTVDVQDDWGARIPRYQVVVDQVRARQAGVSSADIAQALQIRYSGVQEVEIHDGDTAVPVIVRGSESERRATENLGGTLIYPRSGGVPVTLAAVACVTLGSEPSTIQRRNLVRTITVSGRNPSMTATTIVDSLESAVAAFKRPPGYRIEIGGEIEESAETNDALAQYMPHAVLAMLLIFVWQFKSFRKLFIVVVSIPFALIGAALALLATGYPFGFMATFGLLSLGGIIVNNAVLLLERIEEEVAAGQSRHEAVLSGAVKRLRPILMTKLTCIVGLIPLMMFAGPLWTGMAITLIGGLALGTLVTLGLIPVLYDLLFAGTVGLRVAAIREATRR